MVDSCSAATSASRPVSPPVAPLLPRDVRTRRRPRRRSVAAVLLFGAAILTGGFPGGSGQRAAAAETGLAPASTGTARAAGPAQARATTAARSSPVSLRIPALRLTTSVGPLGLNPDRTVEVPKNPERAGWYRFGPAPGQNGSAVILGHRDSKTGPAVFYRLGSLRPGNSIRATLADGGVAHFEVVRVVTYSNAKFPARKVYSSKGPPTLRLVTCGGTYDRRAHAYTANVVVYASFVALTPTTQQHARA